MSDDWRDFNLGGRRSKLSVDQMKLVLDLAREGVLYREIAERFGCSRGYVSGCAVREGIMRRPSHSPRLTAAQKRQIDHWLKYGKTAAEIAERVKCTVGQVRSHKARKK